MNKNLHIISEFWWKICKIQMIKNACLLSIILKLMIKVKFSIILWKIIYMFIVLKIRLSESVCCFLLNLFTITVKALLLTWAQTDYFLTLTVRSELMLWTMSLKEEYQSWEIMLKSFISCVNNYEVDWLKLKNIWFSIIMQITFQSSFWLKAL